MTSTNNNPAATLNTYSTRVDADNHHVFSTIPQGIVMEIKSHAETMRQFPGTDKERVAEGMIYGMRFAAERMGASAVDVSILNHMIAHILSVPAN